METKNQKEYVAPDIKLIEIIVERGFEITGIVDNARTSQIEKHIVEEAEGW